MTVGSDHQHGRRVGSRLVRLCLRPDGTLQRSALLSAATRAALLADLALEKALVNGDDGLRVDTSPTGFVPADKLLAAIDAQPDKSLEWWLRRGLDSVSDVVADLIEGRIWVSRGGWRRRYRDRQIDAVRADAAALARVVRGRKPDTPGTAVLAVLLEVIGTAYIARVGILTLAPSWRAERRVG